MATAPMTNNLKLSANEQFKAQYNKYLRWSALIAVLFTLLAFLFSPNYTPHPYKLRQDEFEVVDIPETQDIELPPPPQEAPPPPKVIEAAPDDEVSEDVEVADTLMDLDTAISQTTGSYVIGDEGFVASSENPRVKIPVKADYPEIARRSQLQGTVIVKVLVGPDGTVKDAQVIQSVHPLLDREALKAARRWTFFPGKQRNIPVKAWMAVPFVFRLN